MHVSLIPSMVARGNKALAYATATYHALPLFVEVHRIVVHNRIICDNLARRAECGLGLIHMYNL